MTFRHDDSIDVRIGHPVCIVRDINGITLARLEAWGMYGNGAQIFAGVAERAGQIYDWTIETPTTQGVRTKHGLVHGRSTAQAGGRVELTFSRDELS